jgi:hypothetical protein
MSLIKIAFLLDESISNLLGLDIDVDMSQSFHA